MHFISIILQAILGLGFLLFGLMKFTSEQMVKGFDHFGLPQWFRLVTGVFEWMGAAGLIAGIWFPSLALYSAIWLGIIMFFAILTHLRAKDPWSSTMMPAVLLILLVVVAVLSI